MVFYKVSEYSLPPALLPSPSLSFSFFFLNLLEGRLITYNKFHISSLRSRTDPGLFYYALSLDGLLCDSSSTASGRLTQLNKTCVKCH